MNTELYHSLFGTRLYISRSGGLIAVSPDYTGSLPLAMDLGNAVSSADCRVSFLFTENKCTVDKKEQAEELLTQIAGALGSRRRGIIWIGDRDSCVLPLRDDVSGLMGAFEANISNGLTLFIGGSAKTDFRADCGVLDISADFEPFQLSAAGCACAFSNATVALCGESAGSATFTVRIAYDDFIRYFPSGFEYAYPEEPDYGVLHFPLLRQYRENPILPLHFQLDFASKLRSSALFTQPGIRLQSRFCSIYGEELFLVTTRTGGFCFPSKTASAGTLMMSPVGEYSVQTQSKTPIKLMCGLSGSEYFVLRQNDTVSFVPEQPAYGARFPEKELSIMDFVSPPPNSPLSGEIVTSWLLPHEGIYVSQPSQAPYYGGSGSILLPVPTQTKLSQNAPSVPIAPYGALEGAKPQTALYEAQVIAEGRTAALARRQSMGEPSPFVLGNVPDDTAQTAASPSGFLVYTREDGCWQKIQLGLSASGEIAFPAPSSALVSAFCSPGLFLAAVTPGSLPDNTVDMDGFRFPLCIGAGCGYNDYKNILLVKGIPGKLYDPDSPEKSLVSSPARWTERGVFSRPCHDAGQQSNLANFLTDYFSQAWRQRENPYFADFAALSADENWQGFLYLNVSLAPESFPPALRFMLPPDGGGTRLHHLGARTTPLKPGPTGPRADKETSIFGLIYYQAAGFTGSVLAPLKPEDFEFSPDELKVLFQNCTVQRFESTAQLTMGDFMGVKPAAGGCPYNTVLLRGAYQYQDGQPSYTLESSGKKLLVFSGGPFTHVTLNQVLMCGGDNVNADFSISGHIAFVNGEGDVWSFESLAFSGMKLICSSGTFSLSLNELAFDIPHSQLRRGSLAQVFSLKPEAIIAGDQNNLPSNQGYAPIVSDFIKNSAFTGKWQGLRLHAVLGTTGTLAGRGGIGASILLAWDGADKTFMGIAMPGAIMVENVLGLSVGAARLILEKGRLMLLLSDVALKCLGLLRLPPSGSLTLNMFEGVGWFAMYKKD